MTSKDKYNILSISAVLFTAVHAFFHYSSNPFSANPIVELVINIFGSVKTFSALYFLVFKKYYSSNLYFYFNNLPRLTGRYIYIFKDEELDCQIFGKLELILGPVSKKYLDLSPFVLTSPA